MNKKITLKEQILSPTEKKRLIAYLEIEEKRIKGNKYEVTHKRIRD